MTTLATNRIATLKEKVLCQISITLSLRSFRKSQKSKLNLRVAGISVCLCNTRPEQCAQKIDVSLDGAKELVIVEQCIVG